MDELRQAAAAVAADTSAAVRPAYPDTRLGSTGCMVSVPRPAADISPSLRNAL